MRRERDFSFFLLKDPGERGRGRELYTSSNPTTTRLNTPPRADGPPQKRRPLQRQIARTGERAVPVPHHRAHPSNLLFYHEFPPFLFVFREWARGPTPRRPRDTRTHGRGRTRRARRGCEAGPRTPSPILVDLYGGAERGVARSTKGEQGGGAGRALGAPHHHHHHPVTHTHSETPPSGENKPGKKSTRTHAHT